MQSKAPADLAPPEPTRRRAGTKQLTQPQISQTSQTTAEHSGVVGAMSNTESRPPIGVGHIHLRVADIDRAIAFYSEALGFTVVADGRAFGIEAAFLAAGDYHHHVALNTTETAGASPPPVGHTGLYHVAFVYPGRKDLAAAVRRLLHLGYPIDHISDHGATLSVYLTDPDDNGVELYYDRPRRHWFQPDGRPVLKADRLELSELIGASTERAIDDNSERPAL